MCPIPIFPVLLGPARDAMPHPSIPADRPDLPCRTRRSLTMNARPRMLASGALLVVLTIAGPSVAPGQEGAPAASAEGLVDRFRAGWTPTGEHMRPGDDDGWKVRMETLSGLVRLGESAVPPLIRALDDPEPDVRVLAAHALSFLADRRAADRLRRTLEEDREAAARLYAADALGAIGGLGPSPLLEKAEAEDANRDVRAHVRFALERHGKPLDDEVRSSLRTFDPRKVDAARVGERAPDFTLDDALGKAYRLADFRGKQAVVLVFIYGDT